MKRANVLHCELGGRVTSSLLRTTSLRVLLKPSDLHSNTLLYQALQQTPRGQPPTRPTTIKNTYTFHQDVSPHHHPRRPPSTRPRRSAAKSQHLHSRRPQLPHLQCLRLRRRHLHPRPGRRSLLLQPQRRHSRHQRHPRPPELLRSHVSASHPAGPRIDLD